MVSKPFFMIPDFFCIFQMNCGMATLRLKEMGKFLWEGRKKGLPCWLFQFSFALHGLLKKNLTLVGGALEFQFNFKNYFSSICNVW